MTSTCCGHRTITDTFDICFLDGIVFPRADRTDPEDAGGPNRVGLRQAQRNFATIRASDPKSVARVRPPKDDEPLDPAWKPLDPSSDES